MAIPPIFWLILFIQYALPLVVLVGPSVLAARNCPAKIYLIFIKSFIFLLLVNLATTFSGVVLFAQRPPSSMNDILIGIIACAGFVSLPVFLQSLVRTYKADFKIFGPTPEQKQEQNPLLELDEKIKVLHHKLLNINIACLVTFIVLLIAIYFLSNLAPQITVFSILLFPLVSLIFFMMLFKAVWFRLKPNVTSEHLETLTASVIESASLIGLPPPQAFVIPPMATVPYNCLAHPKGLYISSLMLQDFPEEERKFIICHELAHIKLGHIKVRQTLRSIYIILLVLSVACMKLFPDAFWWTIGFVVTLILFTKVYVNSLYPRHEFEADALAVKVMANPQAAASCLNRLSVNSAFPKLMELDTPTHPSISKRIVAMSTLQED